MSTQCRFCGEAVRPDSMFCPSCGQLIGASAAAPVPPFQGGSRPRATQEAPVADTASEPLAPVPLPPSLGGPREQPPVASAPERIVPDQAPEPDAPASASAEEQAGPVLAASVRLPDGVLTPVDRLLVLGRSPERGATERGGTAVRLDDPERAMSRVHLLIGPEPAGVAATDPGSANGTLLERDGVRYALVAGTPTLLVRGDRLLLGDAVLIAE